MHSAAIRLYHSAIVMFFMFIFFDLYKNPNHELRLQGGIYHEAAL